MFYIAMNLSNLSIIFNRSILASACFGKFGTSLQLLKILFWLGVTDEGSVPEMRIWSILLIISDLKWCIHLSRSLFFIFVILRVYIF